METRIARSIALVALITVGGGLAMRSCAKRMERRVTAAAPAAIDTASGPPDSARAVALARRAYVLDHRARGETAPPPRLTAFVRDSAGYLVELGPPEGAAGARAVARISREGQVELRRRTP